MGGGGLFFRALGVLLAGSWALISRVIGTLKKVLVTVTHLLALLVSWQP